MSIPKIIWAIWCNFDEKMDGILNERLTYFKDRIMMQHTGWTVNIITKWNELIDYIKEDENLLKIVNNSFISAQHKSDAIRFFLLKKHGGFWIDISTFLLTPLDIYYEKQPNATFITYYTPPLMVEEIIFSSLSQMFDSVKFNEIVEQMTKIQPNYIKLNDHYKEFPFMPENFFIASIPNHPIINDIYEQLLSFWNIAIPEITDKKISLCYQINLLMNELADEMFDINNLDYELSKKYVSGDVTDSNFSKTVLNNVWHCGYVFNYLQMYIAIVNYIKKYNCEITQESNSHELRSEYRADLCFNDAISNGSIDSCKNIIINNSSNGSVVYLLSLSYNRLIKWANTMDERVSFNNTYIKERLDEIGRNPEVSKEKILQDIIDAGIYQIKFSSWTRGSGIIERFMELYPNAHSGGLKNKKKSRKTKKRKNKKRKTHSKSKKYTSK
jgi:hypothetical protein